MRKLTARDKTSLDIFWLKDQSLTDLDNLPEPDDLAEEIIENLEAGSTASAKCSRRYGNLWSRGLAAVSIPRHSLLWDFLCSGACGVVGALAVRNFSAFSVFPK